MLRRRQFVTFALAAAATLPKATKTFAQSGAYPNRNIRFVVPFPPGGGVDVFGRLLSEKLKETYGVTVVVENRAGASGAVGGATVKQSEPDGYTLLFSAATHVMAKQVMRNPPYDPVTDFTPVARIGEAPLLLVMSPKMPQTKIADVVSDARKEPNRWSFAIPALGSPSHIATIAFNTLAGLKLSIVPYRGTAPGLTDVAAGHVQLTIDAVLALLPMARSGNVKALAITASKRSTLAPEIATAAESGMPGLEFASWYGVWGPKDLPGDIVQWLNTACNDATHKLASAGRLTQLGIEPVSQTPQEFVRFIAADVARNTELLRAANFDPV